jgi:hypothetical protein
MTALSSFYVKVIPVNDPWNFPYKAYLGSAAVLGVVTPADSAEVGEDDFVLVSYGRDKAIGPIGASDYTSTTPEGGRYNVGSMVDFNNDLANWNGSWIAGPQTALVGGS